jgi:predicted ATP-grasp superfamily ATP-dependent carboligase
MFYIFSQNFLKGKNKNDRDFLLFIDTLESNNIKYTFLKDQFDKVKSNDYIFLDIGSDDLSKYLNQLNQIKTENIYPNINVIPTLYLKDNFCKFCESKGLKIPKTFYNIEDTTNADYPLVFKPVSGSLSEHFDLIINPETNAT